MKIIPVRKINVPEGESKMPGGLRIRKVKDVLAGKDMVQELHRHDFFFILALERGSGHHVIDFHHFQIKNHSVFFLRPGQVHELTLKSGSTGYLVEFNAGFYEPVDKAPTQLFRRMTLMDHCQLDGKGFNKLLMPLTNIFEESMDRREGYQDAIKANLGIFFIELSRYRKGEKDIKMKASTYEQERLDQLKELLETHIASHKEVSYYAGKLNLSPYQLNAITKATLGNTCSELISEYIVLEAKRYLLATPNQVSQIAYHLGYEDASYFIRFFKKQTGYTPEVFRKNFG